MQDQPVHILFTVTQQPLGGKSSNGEDKDLEKWKSGRLRHIEQSHTLQEMLTIKSDDVVGRAKAFEAIVKGTSIPTPKVPESFKVLIKSFRHWD